MLLGQKGCRHQNGYLFAGPGGHEGSPHGHFGFSEADVATDKPVHRAFAGHILNNRLNGDLLVGGLLEGEPGGKCPVGLFRVFKAKTLAGFPAGVDIQQFGSGVADFLQRFLLGCAPAIRAEFVQRGVLGVVAGIAGDQVQAGYRHIELGAAGVFQHQKFTGIALNGNGFQAPVTADTMVNMHDRRANAQFRQVTEAGIVGFRRLVPSPSLQNPLPEQCGFGNQREPVFRQQESLLHGGDGDPQRAVAVLQKGLPAGQCLQFKALVSQVVDQRLAATGGFRADQHPATEFPEKPLQAAGGVGSAAVHGNIGQGFTRAVDRSGGIGGL